METNKKTPAGRAQGNVFSKEQAIKDSKKTENKSNSPELLSELTTSAPPEKSIPQRPVTLTGKINNLENTTNLPEELKQEIDIYSPRTARQRLIDARNLPPVKQMIGDIWQLGEFHIIFGDNSSGKSVFGIQEAIALALGKRFLELYPNDCEGQVVLYLDYELTEPQFRKRYTSIDGDEYPFPDNLIIANLNWKKLYEKTKNKDDFMELLLIEIKGYIKKTKATVLFIDNITYMSIQTTADAQAALNLIRKIDDLKRELSISICLIAHTPKISYLTPMTINDLAGSKNISNIVDSVTCLGKSHKQSDFRYYKAVKASRNGEHTLTTNNALILKISHDFNILKFSVVGFESEYDHLMKPQNTDKNAELREAAIELKEKGLSIGQIAEKLGKSKSTIHGWTFKEKSNESNETNEPNKLNESNEPNKPNESNDVA